MNTELMHICANLAKQCYVNTVADASENRFLPLHITKHQQQEIFFVRSCAFSSAFLLFFFLLLSPFDVAHMIFRNVWEGSFLVFTMKLFHALLFSTIAKCGVCERNKWIKKQH